MVSWVTARTLPGACPKTPGFEALAGVFGPFGFLVFPKESSAALKW